MKNWSREEFLQLNIPMNLEKVNESEFIMEEKTIENGVYCHSLYQCCVKQPREKIYLTEGTMPSVNPQGKLLAFWREQQLIVRNLFSAEERNLGKFKRPGRICWSQQGKQVIFTAFFEFAKEPENLPELSEVCWIDRLAFKSDEKGIYDGSYRQVYVVDCTDGKIRKLTDSKIDFSNADFLDEYTAICTAVQKDSDISDFADVCCIDLNTLEQKWTAGPGGPIMQLVAEQPKTVLLLSHRNEYWEATNFKLYRLDIASGKLEELFFPLDRSIGNYCLNDIGLNRNAPAVRILKDSGKIWVNVTDGYCTELYELGEKSIRQLTQNQRVIMEYLDMDGGILQLYSEVNVPAVIEYQKNGTMVEIWNENAEYNTIKTWSFLYPNSEGNNQIGYCFLPEKKTLKGMVLDIHGGPHFCHGLAFSIDVHTLTARGYGVCYCNPAGSQGFGQNLSRASYHDWGGKDCQDLLNCVKQVKKESVFSKLKWAVKGGSYGGYMVNWLLGHTQDFVCGISERSTCNRYSQAGTSDCAFRYGKFEFEGFPWENEQSYMLRSPITYVKNITTPVLLIHGDADMNCPISQSEEFYSALKLEGKKAYFARFRGANHSFAITGKPQSRLERYHLLEWWLDYCFN